MLELENTTFRTRLKNRLNILLNTVSACYTYFSEVYILNLMAIYNFRCIHRCSCIHLLVAADDLKRLTVLLKFKIIK